MYASLKTEMVGRVKRKKCNVFLRKDFRDLGSYDQVGRALKKLVEEGQLVSIGYGLYARATKSPSSKKTIPVKDLPALANEAVERLGAKPELSQFVRAYNEAKTTQVPTGRVIAVNGRISRRIGFDGKYVSFERAYG